jgi:hypothetical protein
MSFLKYIFAGLVIKILLFIIQTLLLLFSFVYLLSESVTSQIYIVIGLWLLIFMTEIFFFGKKMILWIILSCVVLFAFYLYLRAVPSEFSLLMLNLL